jgi:uncharacterized protein (DUF488 family)
MTIWTIGHSTHSLDEFVALLAARDIELLVDIRRVPGSRRSPHFHADALRRSLPDRGLSYVGLPRLGGWRRTTADSPNDGWWNRSFRGYADYALEVEFGEGLAQLRELASVQRTAMMCSEALWWRCHRRLVADRLVVAGDTVCHIGSDGRVSAHRLTPFAAVHTDGHVTYPAASPSEATSVLELQAHRADGAQVTPSGSGGNS